MTDDLAELIRSYMDGEELALLPDEAVEIRRNTWAFSFDPSTLHASEIASALTEVAAALRRRFASHRGPATFYAWHDLQAGQLRCSLASVAVDQLPFGNPYVTTADASVVAISLLADATPGFIPWSDLQPVPLEDGAAHVPSGPPTVVWVANIG